MYSTRSHVLDTSLRLFLSAGPTSGLDSLSFARVAGQAQCSVSAIRNRWRTKSRFDAYVLAGLYLLLVREVLESWIERRSAQFRLDRDALHSPAAQLGVASSVVAERGSAGIPLLWFCQHTDPIVRAEVRAHTVDQMRLGAAHHAAVVGSGPLPAPTSLHNWVAVLRVAIAAHGCGLLELLDVPVPYDLLGEVRSIPSDPISPPDSIEPDWPAGLGERQRDDIRLAVELVVSEGLGDTLGALTVRRTVAAADVSVGYIHSQWDSVGHLRHDVICHGLDAANRRLERDLERGVAASTALQRWADPSRAPALLLAHLTMPTPTYTATAQRVTDAILLLAGAGRIQRDTPEAAARLALVLGWSLAALAFTPEERSVAAGVDVATAVSRVVPT